MSAPFDPSAPLAGPPEPWAPSARPPGRRGPPYLMTEMIAAEPHLARRLLARLAQAESAAAGLASAVHEALGSGRSVVVTGCGTSEHAALAIVEILREAVPGKHRSGIHAEQAFELALDPPGDALVVAVSHEGGTWATNLALEAARLAGSTTALVTAAATSPLAATADIVLATDEIDRSWCHTVGYVAPILAGAAVAGHLSADPPQPDAAAALLTAGAADEPGAEAIAARLADTSAVLVLGSGADRIAGRELVLKLEEACWLPSAYRDLETFLHGHLAATDGRTGLVLVLTDRRTREARIARARQALAAASVIGVHSAAILSPDAAGALAEELTPAGRLVVPDERALTAPLASLLASATALQVLAERLARARGTNPDPIRRDDARYDGASAAAAP